MAAKYDGRLDPVLLRVCINAWGSCTAQEARERDSAPTLTSQRLPGSTIKVRALSLLYLLIRQGSVYILPGHLEAPPTMQTIGIAPDPVANRVNLGPSAEEVTGLTREMESRISWMNRVLNNSHRYAEHFTNTAYLAC